MHITAHSTRLAYGGWLTLAVQDSHLLDHSPFAGRTIPILSVTIITHHSCTVNRKAIALLTFDQKYYGFKAPVSALF